MSRPGRSTLAVVTPGYLDRSLVPECQNLIRAAPLGTTDPASVAELDRMAEQMRANGRSR
jgi:hypothetical protein